jgi:hypothetical protein
MKKVNSNNAHSVVKELSVWFINYRKDKY